MADTEHSVAILGSGIPGVAAIITRLVHIAFNANDGDPTVNVLAIDTRDVTRPGLDIGYPLNGRSPRDLHPFYTDKPARGFPTFGEYIDECLKDSEPGLEGALIAPTWRQIHDYMKYVLDLAVTAVGALVLLEFTATPINEIREATPNGPFTIVLTDGKIHKVGGIVRARPPRNMAWPEPAARPVTPVQPPATPVQPQERNASPPPAAQVPLQQEVERALGQSGLPFEAVQAGLFRARVGSRTIAVVAHDVSDDERTRARVNSLVPSLLKLGYTELWLVTREVVGESLLEAATMDTKIQFLTLRELGSLTSHAVASKLRLNDGA